MNTASAAPTALAEQRVPRTLDALIGGLPIRDLEARRAVVAVHTSDDAVCAEVLSAGHPVAAVDIALPGEPFTDEPCVEVWSQYASRARTDGAVAVLRDALVQLQFPIADGVDKSETYLAATRRGICPEAEHGAPFCDPDGIRIDLAPTPVGAIPAITARHRDDFITLVRALTRRNAPVDVPASMGACIVSGYNNWDRVARLRARWERSGSSSAPGADWRATFAALQADKPLYQDRFAVLSTGPYSAVRSAELGLDQSAWLAISAALRREHECAHYVTRRVFGSMQAPLLDEVTADFCALVTVTGSFHEHWFLHFLGLERADGMRAGGRLGNYRGSPPLSDAAFGIMQGVVRRAANSLARADAERADRSREATACLLVAITCLGLELLSAVNGADRLLGLYAAVRPAWPT